MYAHYNSRSFLDECLRVTVAEMKQHDQKGKKGFIWFNGIIVH